MENMKLCQSCAMPLAGAETLGTEANGSPSEDYCCYCFQNGAFTSESTMEEMIEFCAPHMASANPGMSADQAKDRMRAFFPALKRWRP